MRSNLRSNVRYITEEDFENLNSQEQRILGSSSLIVCVVKKNEETNCIQFNKQASYDLQRVIESNEPLSWNKPRIKKRHNN